MTSRNQREGQFIGHAVGKAVRWPLALRRRVRGAKARAVLVRRALRRPLQHLAVLRKVIG